MQALIARLLEQFDSRTVRERILIGLTLFALTWGVWIMSIGGVVIDGKAEVITSIDQLSRDLQLQNDERARLLGEDTAPQRLALEQQQDRLQELIIAQQAELDELLTRFIPPEQVPSLLEDVLRDFSGLRLVRLASQPAEPLLLKTENEGEAKDAAHMPQVTIYRHPVQLEFEGGYLDVMAYLVALESGDWRFAWRKFEYAVEDYPKAQVLIELETLSREKEWLGV